MLMPVKQNHFTHIKVLLVLNNGRFTELSCWHPPHRVQPLDGVGQAPLFRLILADFGWFWLILADLADFG
jgi:hypothetical protein